MPKADGVFASLLGETEVHRHVPVDVLAVFDVAASKGNSIGLVNTGALADLLAPADTKSRILAHIENDQLLIAPKQPVELAAETHMGWWVFDPLTGRISDEFDNGRHQSDGVTTVKSVEMDLAIGRTLRRSYVKSICNVALGAVLGMGLGIIVGGDYPTGIEPVKNVVDVLEEVVDRRKKARELAEKLRKGGGGLRRIGALFVQTS